ncbi:MAG: HAD hydrolase family protein [Melioribacteraceae bacterium]|nr:HAD hydrolase family protein [Melioribacteraceae bacterium]MCF8264870.1 HAD hydrolase family protein [Melioribacteraceae bacterium]
MINIDEKLYTKLTQIKLLISDVDGVLTDGSLYYTADGLKAKNFFVKDGMGTVLLRKNGIINGIISSDKSDIIQVRAQRLKMDFAYVGTWEKKKCAEELCAKYNLDFTNLAFIGDDVNDIELLDAVGFSMAPSDAVPIILERVDYISKFPGGRGAYRELVDMILTAQNRPNY